MSVRYTPAVLDLIRHYTKLGYTTAQIAVEVTRNTGTPRSRLAIYRTCKKYRIHVKPYFHDPTLIKKVLSRRQAGVPIKAIAYELNLTYDVISGILARHSTRPETLHKGQPFGRWSDEKHQALLQLIRQPITYKELAYRLNTTYNVVYCHCYYHNITLLKKPRKGMDAEK